MVRMYYKDGKRFHKIVAAEVAQAPQLWAAAEACASAARGLAAAHNNTGSYISSIKVRPRVTGKKKGRGVDVEVVTNDPQCAKIEWGHKWNGYVPAAQPGVTVGKLSTRRGKAWVNGLHIMRNAAISVGGEGGHKR